MGLDGLTDEELVCRASEGDRGAEELLIHRYQSLVYRRAKPYFLPGADKEDLLQEGMIGLCEAIHGFDREKHRAFAAFASMCVGRQILSAVKRYNRQKHVPLNSSLSLYATQGEEELTLMSRLPEESLPSMEELFISQEEHGQLRRLVEERLSPLEKQVLLLYLQGERYLDIAQRLGRSANGVDSAIQRIRRKLQGALEDGREE